MARAALTQDEVQSFRSKAIRAATKLFAEHGYDGVTMRAIADKLGISAMAPYRYFENKAEIFAMVRVVAMREFTQYYAGELESDAPAWERVIRVRDAYVRFALENPEQYRIIFEVRGTEGEYPDLVAATEEAFAGLLESARLAVEAGMFEGEPLTVAHLLWAHVHGLVSLHLAGKLTVGRSLEQLLAAGIPLGVKFGQRGVPVTPVKSFKRRKPRKPRTERS
jgi:AcrR family transcriptional regulator